MSSSSSISSDISLKSISEKYPLHILVWHNNYEELKRVLQSDHQHDLERLDCRGRTCLHLAVALGHLESIRVLLNNGANANAENSKYWTVVQEGVSTGDPEIVQLCLQYRDYQRHRDRSDGIPHLLQRLRESQDFYVEMKWEFTSWVPLVSRICPSDTYKVWKSGSNVRIDTTLLGFENMSWQRGSRSYIFKGEGETTTLLEVDHDACQVYSETLRVSTGPPNVGYLCPSQDAVAARLTSPIVTTYIDADKIAFERSKSGVWGWRSDKSDTVDGYACKVFSASNVQLVTKTRTEHLSDQDKRRCKKLTRTPLESFLGVAEQDGKAKGAIANGTLTSTVCHNPCSITAEQYFDPGAPLDAKDIGRPAEQTTKVQKLKARLWLCEDYPLSLREQVLPIIDLMASINTHFRKLKDFINLQLPPGFPVKIEIPLYHVLNARITFGNVYASETPADGVTFTKEDDTVGCTVDNSVYAIPASYSVLGDLHHEERMHDEEDDLLQFALRQSLKESASENDLASVVDAHRKKNHNSYSRMASDEDQLLQWALEESLKESQSTGSIPSPSGSVRPLPPVPHDSEDDELLRLALELSQRDLEDQSSRSAKEKAELDRIMELSLVDK